MNLKEKNWTAGTLTVRKLKELIRDWPEIDHNGDECEVWILHPNGHSDVAIEVTPLNYRNIDGIESADLLIGHNG